MIVKSIELLNFRNYRELSLLLDERTNIFYGDNAQGKTNILEAVYLSGTTRSHRGSRDRDLIRFGEEEAHIRTQIRRRDLEYQIDIHLKKNKSKGIAVNGVPIRRARTSSLSSGPRPTVPTTPPSWAASRNPGWAARSRMP